MAAATRPVPVWIAVALLALLVVRETPAQSREDDTLPRLTAPVNDFAHAVDAETSRKIAAICRELRAATGDVLVVATVLTYKPYEDIRWYAAKLFENHGRGIGQAGKSNGLLGLRDDG